jgi:hypothetical protein
MTFQRSGKSISQPDQFILDPRCSFEQFKVELMTNVEEVAGFDKDEDQVILSWKWEKRVVQTTATKKPALPYAIFSRERHWDAVQKALREANGAKNGCHNMLLRILANITSKGNESQPTAQDSVASDSREVLSKPSSLMIVCNLSSTRKTRINAIQQTR